MEAVGHPDHSSVGVSRAVSQKLLVLSLCFQRVTGHV